MQIPVESRPLLRSVLSTAEGIDEVFGLYAYREDRSVRGLVHAMKYRGAQSLCTRIGRTMGAAFREDPRSPGIDILLPVPIHPARRRERRYNQSLLLAEGCSSELRVPWDDSVLIRTRKTPPQAFLGARERAQNMSSAFSIRKGVQAGMRVGLVDDVVTTGATVSSCAQILKRAGVARVVVMCVAVAQADRLLEDASFENVAANT